MEVNAWLGMIVLAQMPTGVVSNSTENFTSQSCNGRLTPPSTPLFLPLAINPLGPRRRAQTPGRVHLPVSPPLSLFPLHLQSITHLATDG